MDKNELWQAVLAKIELTLSRPNFVTWFRETGILSLEGSKVTVYAPNDFIREWLQNKYNKIILHAFKEIAPSIRDITYTITKPDTSQPAPSVLHSIIQRQSPHYQRGDLPPANTPIPELTLHPETNLNPRYTLDSFVVGSFNELAHAAALAVIKKTGVSYNPLFIYGGVGLGKTHLIQAIGNSLLAQNNRCSVRYVPAEKYMSEVVDALKNQEMNILKNKYRSVDLLIMDDIQFIARTEKMQEEFFHIFNALYQNNKQIIISSDRPPHAMATLEQRLRSRFEGGMIADIGMPDFETRLAILTTKIQTKNIQFPEDVLHYIAENVKKNVRELEGVLNRIVVSSQLANTPITIEYTKKTIQSYTVSSKKVTSPKKIIKAVAEFYDIDEKNLLNRSRKKEVVRPRQIAMYIIREELKSSYPSIGDKFGGRDHTTAIHSCEKVAHDLKIHPELEEEIQLIKDRVFIES